MRLDTVARRSIPIWLASALACAPPTPEDLDFTVEPVVDTASKLVPYKAVDGGVEVPLLLAGTFPRQRGSVTARLYLANELAKDKSSVSLTFVPGTDGKVKVKTTLVAKNAGKVTAFAEIGGETYPVPPFEVALGSVTIAYLEADDETVLGCADLAGTPGALRLTVAREPAELPESESGHTIPVSDGSCAGAAEGKRVLFEFPLTAAFERFKLTIADVPANPAVVTVVPATAESRRTDVAALRSIEIDAVVDGVRPTFEEGPAVVPFSLLRRTEPLALTPFVAEVFPDAEGGTRIVTGTTDRDGRASVSVAPADGKRAVLTVRSGRAVRTVTLVGK